MNEVTWSSGRIWFGRIIILGVFFGLWEWASSTRMIEPILIGAPSGIVQYLWKDVIVAGSLWKDFGYTMGGNPARLRARQHRRRAGRHAVHHAP